MGWGAVWQLALKQFGAESVEIRILVLVTAAFLVLMILIGLKHAFRPAGPRASEPAPASDFRRPVLATPSPVAAVVVAEPQQTPPPVATAVPARTPKPLRRATRKCAKHTVNHQRATRPRIRRAETAVAVEIDAGRSPLPLKP